MRPALKSMGLVLAIAVSGASWLAVAPSYAATGEEVINARSDFMKKQMEEHWKPIGAFAKSGVGSLDEVAKNASEIAELAKKIPEHFPKDTGRGALPDKVTRTLPVVWTDPDGFKKAVQAMVDGSAKLASLAKAGDKAGAIALIGESGSYARTKIGCSDCHDKFRGAAVR